MNKNNEIERTHNSDKNSVTEDTDTIITTINKISNSPRQYCCSFLYNNSEIRHLEFLLDNISNSREIEKHALKSRYIYILKQTETRANLYSRFYYIGHFIVTVGSLIVPALLSIQFTSTNSMTPSQFQEIIYWATWILSLMVTISNGILTLFKVDKKYNSLQIMLQKLKSEGYQFVSLTGRYYIKNYTSNPYDTQLSVFSYQIEKIIQKQVDDEYYKTLDGHIANNGKDGTNKIDEFADKHAYTIQEPSDEVNVNENIVATRNKSYSSNLPQSQPYVTSTREPIKQSVKTDNNVNDTVRNYIHSSKLLENQVKTQASIHDDIEKGETPSKGAIILSASSKNYSNINRLVGKNATLPV